MNNSSKSFRLSTGLLWLVSLKLCPVSSVLTLSISSKSTQFLAMTKLVWPLLAHIEHSTNTVYCVVFWSQMFPVLLWKVTVWCIVYLEIPGFFLVGSRLQLGGPNRHDWSQQLERQREPCRGHGADERLSRQVYRQWCWGSMEPWDWAELPGGPGHLSSLRKEEDYLVWWGKDVWWVQSCSWKFMPFSQHLEEDAANS